MTSLYGPGAYGVGLYSAGGSTFLTNPSFDFNGITIDNDGPYYIQDVDGWLGPPDGTAESVPRSTGHGSRVTFMRRGVRTVTISGLCASKSSRDSLFWALRAAMAIEGMDTAELMGTVAGLTLTADAQLQRFRPVVSQSRAAWSRGMWAFDAQWLCPDPLLYGGRLTMTSPIGTLGTGLALPNTLPVAFPDNPTGGRVTVTNTGTAKTPAIYTLQGPMKAPGVSVNGGTQWQRAVQYEFDLQSTERLVIDTEQGAAFLNGEYRAPQSGSNRTADLRLRPQADNTVEALGEGQAGSPSISVSFRPAYW